MGKKTFKFQQNTDRPVQKKKIDFWTLTPSATFTSGLLCWKLLHLMKLLKPQNCPNEN